MYAITVGLIRNLKTGIIIPQFYVFYDSEFETVNSNNKTLLKSGYNFTTFNYFRLEYDYEDYIHELDQ